MKYVLGAFLAIMAVNSAPGLPAWMASYLSVAVVLAAFVIYFIARAARSGAVDPAPQPVVVHHIHTTAGGYPGAGGYPWPQMAGPTHVHSERVGQVILPDSIYQR